MNWRNKRTVCSTRRLMGRCPGCAAFSLAPRADRQTGTIDAPVIFAESPFTPCAAAAMTERACLDCLDDCFGGKIFEKFRCPLLSRKRTFDRGVLMSAKCQQQTHAVQQYLRHTTPTCCSTRTGSVKENVEPLPTTESTQILPPCISIMRLEIASPKPVPPLLRAIELSAC
jgi:hypothetical protein